jgi:hypothetical protein
MIPGLLERASRTIVPGQMLAAFGLPAEERLRRPLASCLVGAEVLSSVVA